MTGIKMSMQRLNEICKNCNCTLGAHSATGYYSIHYEMHIPQNYCPGHEGRMNWDKGPGTCFEPTGLYKEEVE